MTTSGTTRGWIRAILAVNLGLLAGVAAAGCSSGPKSKDAESVGVTGSLKPLWTVTESVQSPESAYFHEESGFLFVSNVVGEATAKDGQGWISKLDMNGKVLEPQWISGLNAPKGMRASGNTLWVSDIDQVVSIEIPTGKIKSKVAVKGAKFLNDVAVGPKGEVYVSDMLTGKIHVIRGGKASVFMAGDKLESPNGLLVVDGKLFVAGWGEKMKPDFSTKTPGHLYSLDLATKKKTLVTLQPLGHLDGLERREDGSFVVTDWMAGKVYSVGADGKSQVLLEGFKGAADIGIIPESKTLIVPRMGENQVTAYHLGN